MNCNTTHYRANSSSVPGDPTGSTGDNIFQLTAQQIDPSIRTEGAAQNPETVLWMALHPDTIGGLVDPVDLSTLRWQLPHTPGPRWRSITEPLSATGVDLSRIEYLELWLLDSDQTSERGGLQLVFDFGTLFEDAAVFQPTQFAVAGSDTTYSGRRRAGEGRLDSERDSLTGAFNAAINDIGVLGDVADSIVNTTTGNVERDMPLCRSDLGNGLKVYDWGSLLPHCTRRNGTVDSEDLNNDQHLDTLIAARTEDVFRYVLRVGDPRYYVRDGGNIAGVGRWKLYRIPFRSDTAQIGVPDFRQVRAMRVTFVAPGPVPAESSLYFALARMRLVGAPWVKRSGTPIPGLAGLVGALHGEVIASVVSTENRDDLGYEPPPGVIETGGTLGGGQTSAVQVNERSLRLVATGVQPGERAEAYFRFPEGERNFLGYREMRVWARGRGADWDANRLTFFVKVAQDENNFYLYRQPLRTTTWDPEAVVNFQEWFALRALIEERFLRGDTASGAAACGGDPAAYVACNGPYLVHVRNPAVAPPNLTRVQELAVGFLRDSGSALDSAELWVDDIRLSQVVDDKGYAGAVSLGLIAADVADLNVLVSRRDGNFRQLGENPAYVATNEFSLASTIRMERLGLERLGLTAPLSLRLDRGTRDPYFVSGTDVLASGLTGLRTPRTGSTSWGLALRRTRRGTEWWQRSITDNLGFTGLWASGTSRTELSNNASKVSNMRLDYSLQPGDRRIPALPGFLRSLLDKLPDFLRRSDMVRGLRDGQVRLTPSAMVLTTELARATSSRESYRVPIATPFDSALPVHTSQASLRTTAGVDFRPTNSLTLGASAGWDRDLKDYGDSTTMGALATQRAQSFLGMDIGFVRTRRVGTRLSWAPPVASWLRPRLAWLTDFSLSRDPTAAVPERSEGDTAGAFRLPTVFGNNAALDLGATVDLSRLLRGLLGDSSGLLAVLDRVTQLDLGRRLEWRSQYDRPGFDPGGSYMLGFSGLLDQNGQLASSAQDQQQDRINMVLRLPLGINLTGTYGEREVSNWFLRGVAHQQQSSTETDWPNLQARWIWNTRTGWVRKVITTINASAGVQDRSTVSRQPLLGEESGGLRFSQSTRSRPLNLSVGWAPGITTTVSRTDERSEAQNLGNLTLGERSSLAADASFSFRAPQELLPIRAPVRTSLRYLHSLNALCVERVGAPSCTPIADSRRTEYNLTMDTDMPPSVTAGLSVGYVLSDDRHINRKFAQFILTTSVRVFFNAGEVR